MQRLGAEPCFLRPGGGGGCWGGGNGGIAPRRLTACRAPSSQGPHAPGNRQVAGQGEPRTYSVLRVCLRPKMNQTSSTTKHGSLKKSPSPSFQFGLRILGLRKNESQACWSLEPTGETPKPAPVSGRHTRSPSRPRANPTVPLERDTVPSLQDLAAPRSESSVPSGPFQLSSDI